MRNCYHEFDALVTNTNSEEITDVTIQMTIYDEEGQMLSDFETGYRSIGANETKELAINHGPQENQCWPSGEAGNYSVNVEYGE